MKEYEIAARVKVYDYTELSAEDKELVDLAKAMTLHSYAPYSHFYVGAALKLDNGVVMKGCNQENAASPATICAERSAIFAAGAQYPDVPVVACAIAARNDDGFMATPTPPCGTCRQVMLETEHRFGHAIRILLVSETGIHVFETIKDLLPLQFVSESMK